MNSSHPQFLDPRLPDLFWGKVIPEPNSGCWIWIGASANGYGTFYFDGKNRRAHRVAFAALASAVPADLVLDHLCRNTLCVCPMHLEIVPDKTNILRGVGQPAMNHRKTHCIRGHEFVVDTRGYRRCPQCQVIHKRNHAFRHALDTTGGSDE